MKGCNQSKFIISADLTKNCYSRALTSSHLSENAPKRQQKSQDNYLMVKHDQEMHMTGNAQKERELKFRRRKLWHKQSNESSRSFWNWPITRRFNKKQPIKTPKIKRCWQTLKQASSINTATFGPKVSLFKDSLHRYPWGCG